MVSLRKFDRWAVVHFLLLLGLLFLAVAFSGSNHELRLNLQHSVFDQFNRLYPRESTGQVLIVDIDEKSLEAFGQWPWPRNIMARLVDRLHEMEAKVIAFDGVFGEEDRSSPKYLLKTLPEDKAREFQDLSVLDYDAMFAESIKKSGIFVSAFTYGRTNRKDNKPPDNKRVLAKSNVSKVFLENASYFEAAAVDLPVITQAAAGNGSFMARPDSDGVLRRAGMIFTDRKTLYPSLSLEALRVAFLGRKGTVRLAQTPEDERGEIDTEYRIAIGDMIIPVESDGIVNVYYRYFCNEDDLVRKRQSTCAGQDYISARDILDEKKSEHLVAKIKGKIILIGASAEGLKDLRSTPLQPFRPGVEVHANVVEQVLQGKYLLRPVMTQAAEATFILAAGLFFILLAPFIGVLVSFLLCVAIIGMAVFGAYSVYVDYGILVDPVYPSLAVLMIFVVSTILSYARAETRRKQIRNAFGMYVAPDVMRDLENNPEKLKLGGELRELTVMFTDIRKFTSISEGLSPEEIIQMMNEFLTVMTDIVMTHKGTVDKYIGDAMMAFWNAPRDVKYHERLACLAALKMQAALSPINEKIAARAQAQGKQNPVTLNVGIGINTGACAVGNMGSKQRFAYSALGDAVNLASRLEGQTKFYGVNVLMGDSTQKECSDLAVLELDLIRVMGKSQPVRIYGLFGDETVAVSEDFRLVSFHHQEFMKFYRDRQFQKALEEIAICKNLSQGRKEGLYAVYEARIQELQKINLPQDWDGVYVAGSK